MPRERTKLTREEEKNLWFKIFTPIERSCGECKQAFRCSGNCPEGRWSNSEGRKGVPESACFCKTCLKESVGLGLEYIKKRLEVCY
jgi:radical SAM protein with 4Fe4S-binding SPASM domain